MVAWYRDLIALRRCTPDLRDRRLGAPDVTVDPATRTVCVVRGGIEVVANLGTEPHAVGGDGEVLLASTAIPTTSPVVLPPTSVLIRRV
jgi:hypothetical protein